MSDVFISHVEENTQTALEIARGLEGAGYTTWTYERDSCPGPDYLDQVERAIDESQAVIVLISPDALGSQQVEDEVKWAREQGKHLVPILEGISWSEFQSRRPRWRMALGIATAVSVPPEGAGPIFPRLVRGLRELGVKPGGAEKAKPAGESAQAVSEEPLERIVGDSTAFFEAASQQAENEAGATKETPGYKPRAPSGSLSKHPPFAGSFPTGPGSPAPKIEAPPLVRPGDSGSHGLDSGDGSYEEQERARARILSRSKPSVARAALVGAVLLIVGAGVWQLVQRKQSMPRAVQSAQKGSTVSRREAAQHVDRGNELMRSSDPDGAIAEYREAIRLRPDYAVAHLELGHALVGKDDLDGAIAECREAVRLKPNYEQAHYVLGNALGKKENWEGAVLEEREAIRLKPDDARAHLSLGRAYEREGMRQAALDEYRKAHEIDPGNPVFLGDYTRLAKQLRQR
jgi:tetratricopeptide (TPR) repeat protein